MKLTERKFEELRAFKITKNLEILNAFKNSGYDIAEVSPDEGEKFPRPSNVSGALNRSIQIFKFPNIKSFTGEGRVYLVRTDKVDISLVSRIRRG